MISLLPPVEEMIRAYQNGDESYDGIFFVAVRTTGIVCRPSCPARKPYPQNVEFFATVREALFAGYRPCKRCHPLEIKGQLPEWVAPLVNEIEGNPSLRIQDGDLRARGVDPARVRRFFIKRYGMTFQAYCRARRLGVAFEAIREGATLDHVVFEHGYESHSGFREAFKRMFGQAPGQSREGQCIYTAWLESPIGPLIAGASDEGVCLLEFTDRRMLETQFKTLQRIFKQALVPGSNEHLTKLQEELTAYFEGTLHQFTVPLVYPGTPFQQKVWSALLEIPYGKTWSYEALANHIGAEKGQRAVGHANGLNRIAIVIPCHRVVNKDGKLGGYGGGLWRKQWLLALENGQHPAVIDDPTQQGQLPLF